MKKILSLFIVITMLLSLPLFIYAEGEAETLPPPVSEDMAELLNSQISPEEKEIIFNKSYYSAGLSDTPLNDVPMLKVYFSDYVHRVTYRSATLSNFIPTLSEAKTYDVVLFDDEGTAINISNENGTHIIQKPQKVVFPPSKSVFLNEIRSMQKETTIFDQKCTIEQIFCFYHEHTGVAVAIITDKGNFIKYYDSWIDSGVMFTEEEFNKSANEFNQYQRACGEILGRVGLNLYGGSYLIDYLKRKNNGTLMTLEEFEAYAIAQKKKEQEWLEKQESNKTQTDTEAVPSDTAPAEPEGKGLSPWVWVAIVSGAALVIAVPTAAVVISKRKKKNS